MTTIKFPKTTVNKLSAQVPAGVDSQKILVIGQKTSGGSAAAGALNIGVAKADINTLFGERSIVANQLRPIFKLFEDSQSDTLPRVDVIALDDAGAATAAASTITITAASGTTATEAGTITFKIAGKEFAFDVAEGATIADLGAALNTLIGADSEVPFTATETGNVVTMTAVNKGTVGNNIPVSVSGVNYNGSDYVLGNVEVAITAFTTGATDPTMTNVLDVVGDTRYQTITAPIEYGTDYVLGDFLDTRFNVQNDILDGVFVAYKADTVANLKTLASGLNSQSALIIGDKVYTAGDFKGGALQLLGYDVAAQVSAIRAMRLTDGCNILNITPAASYGALDGVGGMEIASLPYANTIMNDVDVINDGIGFSKVEIAELKTAGISVIGNNVAKNGVVMGEMVSTYLTDGAGNDDVTWHFLNTIDTMSVSAEYIFKNLKKRFAQSRLTSGAIIAGRNMTNETIIKAYLAQLYKELSAVTLVPAGKEAEDYFYSHIQLEIDYVEGSVTTIENFPIVVQLREIVATLLTKFGAQ